MVGKVCPRGSWQALKDLLIISLQLARSRPLPGDLQGLNQQGAGRLDGREQRQEGSTGPRDRFLHLPARRLSLRRGCANDQIWGMFDINANC